MENVTFIKKSKHGLKGESRDVSTKAAQFFAKIGFIDRKEEKVVIETKEEKEVIETKEAKITTAPKLPSGKKVKAKK